MTAVEQTVYVDGSAWANGPQLVYDRPLRQR
jgi:hypothetical protein